MGKTILVAMLMVSAGLLAGCDNCLSGGRHGVPDPGPGEWQLVFTTKTTREIDLFVDGEKEAVICPTTNEATVGNFPVHSCNLVNARSREIAKDCFYSPNCSLDCTNQSCSPDACLDTEGLGYEGRRIVMTLIYR